MFCGCENYASQAMLNILGRLAQSLRRYRRGAQIRAKWESGHPDNFAEAICTMRFPFAASLPRSPDARPRQPCVAAESGHTLARYPDGP